MFYNEIVRARRNLNIKVTAYDMTHLQDTAEHISVNGTL